MEHFNKLTPGEAERLAILAEEAGEVIQIIGKILRHGYESYNPFDMNRTTNRVLLEREMADFYHAVGMLSALGDVSALNLSKETFDRVVKGKKYTHHQTLKPNPTEGKS